MLPLLSVATQILPSIISMIDSDSGAKAEKVASVVANVTGTSDPDHAREVLKDPVIMAELQKGLNEVTVQLAKEETRRLQSINQTMQVEAQSDKWWVSGWRPFWGFISGTAFFVLVIFICMLAYQAISGKQPEAIAMIPQLIGSFAALFGIPGAILGVASWHRGKEKRIKAGEQAQAGMIDKVVGAFKK